MSGAFGALVFDDWDSPDLEPGLFIRYDDLTDLSGMCDEELAVQDGEPWPCTRLHRGQPGQHVATDMPDPRDGIAMIGAVWGTRPTLALAATPVSAS